MTLAGPRFVAKRWWWRKFHPLVRVGWVATRSNPSNHPLQTYVGLALIGVGLVAKRPKKRLIYSTSMDANTEFRIKVIHAGKSTTIG